MIQDIYRLFQDGMCIVAAASSRGVARWSSLRGYKLRVWCATLLSVEEKSYSSSR
jgi:hypothetical protein